ncbi:tetratricopeptide repeat protein [Corallococcus macrosporus]|uniref:Tetratricopeptide repeat protein n=1 Tax=Corallococcus macrosporus TaxID=35 RepID=A0ABS3D8U8_9BACT|nr:tetratricopeptide repeat protein [Corallococcus macrosporus]MBN8228073.1 tetratricopeptide repeat protein [Corallococcus macrosporus]
MAAIRERGEQVPNLDGSAMDRYAALFQAAYPHAEQRRAFLHHQIKSAHISAANLRLAHLVSSGRLANIVVTTNFDELLAKALRLFRLDVIVCDHPGTTRRIDVERNDPQIVHVHGTHWFYDCCNLNGEIELRAANDPEANDGMRHLLDRILSHRSPLVVGYSGWEKDVVMGALRRRLRQEPLRHNLYWFCFERSEVERLPGWLVEHGNVRLVVPSIQLQGKDGASDILGSGGMRQDAGTGTTSSVGTGDLKTTSATLPARQVLDALVRELNLDEPELTRDPLDFFEKFLSGLVAPDVPDDDDTYLIRSVIRRVKDGADLVRREAEQSPDRAMQAAFLMGVNGAVRRAAYPEALEIARSVNLTMLLKSQIPDLDGALEAICRGIASETVKAKREWAPMWLEASNLWIRLCEIAQDRTDGSDPHWNIRWGMASNSRGAALVSMNNIDGAVVVYDEVVRRFGRVSEARLKERVAYALFNKAKAFSDAGRFSEAVAAYDDFLTRFGQAVEDVLKERVAGALIGKGLSLEGAGKVADGVAVYEEIVRRFGGEEQSGMGDMVAVALFRKGSCCYDIGRYVDSVEAYSELIRRIESAPKAGSDGMLALALTGKANSLSDGGRWAESLVVYDEVERRFGEASDSYLRMSVARAMHGKGEALQREGKRSEAIGVYDEIIKRYAGSSEQELKDLVAAVVIDRMIAVDGAGL